MKLAISAIKKSYKSSLWDTLFLRYCVPPDLATFNKKTLIIVTSVRFSESLKQALK